MKAKGILFDPYRTISGTLRSQSYRNGNASGIEFITDVLRPDIPFVQTAKLADRLLRFEMIGSQLFYQIGSSVVIAALKSSNLHNKPEEVDEILQGYLSASETVLECDEFDSRAYKQLCDFGFLAHPEQHELSFSVAQPLQTEDTRLGVGITTGLIEIGRDEDPCKAIKSFLVRD